MYILYIYDKNFNVINQIFDLNNLNINLKLSDISTAKFDLFYDNPSADIQYFKEYTKIKIIEQYSYKDQKDWILLSWFWDDYNFWIDTAYWDDDWDSFNEQNTNQSIINKYNKEIIIFEWVIKWLDCNLNKFTVYCEDYWYLLSSKLIFNNYYWTSVNVLLNTIFLEINSRENTNLTIESDITDGLPTGLNISSNMNVYDIISKLCELWNYQFIWDSTKLIIKNKVGYDRTQWELYYMFRYDKSTPEENNIKEATWKTNWDNLANYVRDSNWLYYSDSSSISEYWLIEKYFDSTTQSLANYVNDRKNWIFELNIIPADIKFHTVNIWDVCDCLINTWGNILSYSWSVTIVEKTLESGNIDKISIKINSSSVKTLDIIETIKKLKQKVNILENK